MNKENPGVPAGYLLREVTTSDKGMVSCWVSPDGRNHVAALERFARRHGLTFGIF